MESCQHVQGYHLCCSGVLRGVKVEEVVGLRGDNSEFRYPVHQNSSKVRSVCKQTCIPACSTMTKRWPRTKRYIDILRRCMVAFSLSYLYWRSSLDVWHYLDQWISFRTLVSLPRDMPISLGHAHLQHVYRHLDSWVMANVLSHLRSFARGQGNSELEVSLSPWILITCASAARLEANVLVHPFSSFKGQTYLTLSYALVACEFAFPFEQNVLSQPGSFACGQGKLGLVCSPAWIFFAWSLAVYLEPNVVEHSSNASAWSQASADVQGSQSWIEYNSKCSQSFMNPGSVPWVYRVDSIVEKQLDNICVTTKCCRSEFLFWSLENSTHKVPQREKTRGTSCFGNLGVILFFAQPASQEMLANVRKGWYKQTIQMGIPTRI